MRNTTSIEFAITTPNDVIPNAPFFARARTTMGALVEVIKSSSDRLVFSAPFMDTGIGLKSDPMSEAIQMAISRGVSLEIAGSRSEIFTVAENFSKYKNVRCFLPQEGRLGLGSHAKFCVNNNLVAYLGSANFTYSGINRNLEMGVLLKGLVASQLLDFWDYLLREGTFNQIGV